MRNIALISLVMVACTDVTTIENDTDMDVSCSVSVTEESNDPAPEVAPVVQQKESAPNAPPNRVLCLSPVPELLGYVRDSAERFWNRLAIPIRIGERCIPVTTAPAVWDGEHQVSAAARSRGRCVFEQCNSRAYIVIDEILLTDQLEWLPNLLDHEIGHILSAWGRGVSTGPHLPPGHIMAAVNKRTNHWTQSDADFWCSGSPCGVTSIDEEQYGRSVDLPTEISDAGTSSLSDSGKEGPAQDAEASGDGGY